MLCHSMTGYGQALFNGETVRVKVEIRAVNHRFADIAIRTAKDWLPFEEVIRETVRKYVDRGRIDVYLTVDPVMPLAKHVVVDWALLDALHAASREAAVRYGQAAVEDGVPGGWIAYPDVLQIVRDGWDAEAVEQELITAVQMACTELVGMRKREGQRMCADMVGKLDTLARIAASMTERAPIVARSIQDRLAQRMADVASGVDEPRLWTEIAVMMDRIGIDEELVRLDSHLAEFRRSLATGGLIGRRLDFLVQEMNREVNTIGSKAADLEVSKGVVDAKVILEQLREQAQNIE